MKPDRWTYADYSPKSPEAIALAENAKVPALIAALALNRGICTAKELRGLIENSADQLHSPFLMHDMDRAVLAIRAAALSCKKITVYGDYDVDGITSVSVLVLYLRSLGAHADYYIPDRTEEGYGVNAAALDAIRARGADMVITVDTGITAVSEAEHAASIGLELIVTDHHQCRETRPDCIVINPYCPDSGYPFKSLAGVGVVFKLICAMENGDPLRVLEKYGDLIALGTIADVVSLTGENRIIVSYGLQKLSSSPHLGLSMLLQTAGLDKKPVSVTGVGFGLAPRINAAGRIGDTTKAVSLLLSDSGAECMEIARYLDEENKCRQATEQNILSDVLKIIDADAEYNDKRVLVISGCGWHHGVIGIVSSRITEKFTKPCILISCENGVGKGSGRSVRGFNLFEALCSCPELFEKFGGHELAAGLTVPQENIAAVDQKLNEYALKHMPPECLLPNIMIDFELPCEYLTVEAIESLYLLEPFGTGNPQPCFSVSDAKIVAKTLMGNGKHTRLSLQKDGVTFDVVAFGKSNLYYYFTVNDRVDIAGTLSVNEWRDNKKPQMFLKSIRLHDAPAPCSPVPDREDLKALYLYLKQCANDSVYRENLAVLSRKLTYETKCCFDMEKLKNCLEIFAELRLLTFVETDGAADIYLLAAGGKVDIGSSKKLQQLQKE